MQIYQQVLQYSPLSNPDQNKAFATFQMSGVFDLNVVVLSFCSTLKPTHTLKMKS